MVTADTGPAHLLGRIKDAAWTSGKVGAALEFHGGGQFQNRDAVIVEGSTGLEFGQPFSVEAWVKVTGAGAYQAVVDKHEYKGGPAAGFSLYLTQGRLRLTVYAELDGDADVMGTTDLRDGRWHFVSGAWDGSRLVVSVDGLEEGEVAWTLPPAASMREVGVGLRSAGWGGYLPFQGVIDEVVIRRLAPPVTQGYVAFAKLDGIQGEVKSSQHSGWVRLLGFRAGVAVTPASGGGGTAARGGLLPFELTKLLDRASVPLLQACASGRTLETVIVELLYAPRGRVVFYRIKMTDVLVTRAVQAGNQRAVEPRPVDTVALVCGKIEWTYARVDAFGIPKEKVTTSWDEVLRKAEERSAPVAPDTDQDAIPDEAEVALDLVVGEDDADLDDDGDGLSNYQEYLAGTHPRNPDSVLKVSGVTTWEGEGFRSRLTWASRPGAVYDVLASDHPSGPYRRVASVAGEMSETTSFEVSGPEAQRFFQIELRPE